MNNSLYVIIVTYNGMPWLKRCLDSCNSYKVIVVDNASTDETVSFIKANYPEVLLLEQTKNLGFGAANNIGISHALNKGAEYVFLLNQDAYLQNKNTINKLVAVSEKHSEYGVLSPIHLNGDWNKLDEKFSYYIDYKNNSSFYFDAINCSLKDIYAVPFVNAAAWLIPKETLNSIGGFDFMFFHYGEDDNYCQRLNYHNLKLGVVTSTYIAHDREGKKKQTKLSSQQYLNHKEKSFKLILGNINSNFEQHFTTLKIALFRKFFSAVIKLKISTVILLIREYWLLRTLKSQVKKSRETNKEIGRHYLNL